jgi:hypothetical protein
MLDGEQRISGVCGPQAEAFTIVTTLGHLEADHVSGETDGNVYRKSTQDATVVHAVFDLSLAGDEATGTMRLSWPAFSGCSAYDSGTFNVAVPCDSGCDADLAVVYAADRQQVAPLEPFTFTLTATNSSASRSRSATLKQSFERDIVEVLGTTPSAGTCSTAPGMLGPYETTDVTCEVGDVAPGTTATVAVRVRALFPGRVQGTGSARSTVTPDPNPQNGSALAVTNSVSDAALLSGSKLKVRAGRIRVPVHCPSSAGCTGMVRVRVLGRGKGRNLGSSPYALGPGKSDKIPLKLTKPVRRELARKGSVRAVGFASGKTGFGWASVTTRALTLKRR